MTGLAKKDYDVRLPEALAEVGKQIKEASVAELVSLASLCIFELGKRLA